jgi:hypothetical protein
MGQRRACDTASVVHVLLDQESFHGKIQVPVPSGIKAWNRARIATCSHEVAGLRYGGG